MFIKCHCNALDQFHVVSPGQYSPFSEGFVNLIISFEETIKNHWTPIKGENVSENDQTPCDYQGGFDFPFSICQNHKTTNTNQTPNGNHKHTVESSNDLYTPHQST